MNESDLTLYRYPTIYDFIEKSAFASDLSISLQAISLAFGHFLVNAGSARTMVISTNDAWTLLFREIDLTKSMLFKDESNKERLKSIIMRFFVSSSKRASSISKLMR